MLKSSDKDTIVALSTPPGEGGIGMVRVSGPSAVDLVGAHFESKSGQRLADQKSFTTRLGHFVSSLTKPNQVIDEVLVTVMRAPKSYTCEDVVEISAHGGMAPLHGIVERLILSGARLALPGEFTKRAFLNGRIDLLQAEAVLDLIESKTDLSLRVAEAQLDGSLTRKIKHAKQGLVQILSQLEAEIDFPEDDIQESPRNQIHEKIRMVCLPIQTLLHRSSLGILIKKGAKITLVGRPNVGKSSLLNALSQKNRSIVTAIPGTTRDVVEETIQIKGLVFRLSDTAGIRPTDQEIEREGIERSFRAADEADLLILVLDQSDEIQPEDVELMQRFRKQKKIIIFNKSDLPTRLDKARVLALEPDGDCLQCSTLKSEGTQMLEDKIFKYFSKGILNISEEPVLSSIRQKTHLEACVKALSRALSSLDRGLSYEFIASDIRLALDELGLLVGEVVNDEILDVLFSQFCIGK